MSFGTSLGDVVKLSTLSWQVYKALSTAGDVFKTLVPEVSNMHTAVQLVKEALEKQDVPQSLQRDLVGIALTCEVVLRDAQKLVEKHKSLGTVKSRRFIDRAGLAMEDIVDLRNRLISATSLLNAFQTTLHGRSHSKIIETLEGLRKDICAGTRDGSVLSNLAIEDLQNNKEDIWREVMIELEDAGLDPEVVRGERQLITEWFEETLLNGGFDEDFVADSSSERTASPIRRNHFDRRHSPESVDRLILPQSLVDGSQNSSSLSVDRVSYVSSSATSSVWTTESPIRRKHVARVLDNSDIRVELAKLNDLVSSAATVRSTKLERESTPEISAKLQLHDVNINIIISEDLRDAVKHETNIRIRKSKLERRTLPLPWGWVYDGSIGLYRNSITSDTASNLPLLNMWSFAVMSYELLPRCIQATRHNLENLNKILPQSDGPIQTAVIEALWSIKTLAKAISKFGIFFETCHSIDHICTQIMLLKESNENDELLQSMLESDLLSAHNVYLALMQQILSLLHTFSLIFSFKNSPVGHNHILLSWQKRKMVERMALLKQQLDDKEYWMPAETGIRKILSWYSINSLKVEDKSAKLASIWSQFYKTKQGGMGDKITIQLISAISTAGIQLEKARFRLDRIGSIIAQPLVPLDTVFYFVRVLVDGYFLFQTVEDERVSPFSRFWWNTTRTVLATNCQNISFEVWDHDTLMGFKRRRTAEAVGRVSFKSPMSNAAQLYGEDLSKSVNTTAEIEMISTKSGKTWGTLRIGFSWEGRDAIAANIIAANGLPVEVSHSEAISHTFVCSDYMKVSRKIGLL